MIEETLSASQKREGIEREGKGRVKRWERKGKSSDVTFHPEEFSQDTGHTSAELSKDMSPDRTYVIDIKKKRKNKILWSRDLNTFERKLHQKIKKTTTEERKKWKNR